MKNKIFTKIILVVVSVSVLIATLVLPSFADESDDMWTTGDNVLNNPYGVEVALPVGYLSVDNVFSDTGAGSGRAPTNIPLFNYAGSGREGNWSYSYSNGSTASMSHFFDSSRLFEVDALPSGFYGLYNSGSTILHNSSGSSANPYCTRISSFNLSNAIFASSSYSWLDIKFEHLYNSSLDPTLIDLTYTISCTYFKESEDGLLTYTSPTPVHTQCQWDGSYGLYYYRIPLIPAEILQSDNIVYVENLKVDFMLSNQHPLDVDEFRYVNRLSVPTRADYKRFVDVMLGHTWAHGYDDGLDKGYRDGYFEGQDVGIQSGYTTGYNEGYDIGVNEGYDEGYTAGFNAGGVSPFESIVNAITSFLSWQFIPGVSFGLVLSLIVGASLLILFLKIFAGG